MEKNNIVDSVKFDIINNIFNYYVLKYSFVKITKEYLIEIDSPFSRSLPYLYEYSIRERKLYPKKYTTNDILLADFDKYCVKLKKYHDILNKEFTPVEIINKNN